jgi:hypothetical protein
VDTTIKLLSNRANTSPIAYWTSENHVANIFLNNRKIGDTYEVKQGMTTPLIIGRF